MAESATRTLASASNLATFPARVSSPESRRKADVQVYFDQPAGTLPPVVKKIP